MSPINPTEPASSEMHRSTVTATTVTTKTPTALAVTTDRHDVVENASLHDL